MNKAVLNLIFILTAIAFFGAFVYYRYFQVVETDEVVVEEIYNKDDFSNEIIQTLNEVNKITIETSIFKKGSNLYQLTLSDLKHFDPKVINTVKAGKDNIFIDANGGGYISVSGFSNQYTQSNSYSGELNNNSSSSNSDSTSSEGNNRSNSENSSNSNSSNSSDTNNNTSSSNSNSSNYSYSSSDNNSNDTKYRAIGTQPMRDNGGRTGNNSNSPIGMSDI